VLGDVLEAKGRGRKRDAEVQGAVQAASWLQDAVQGNFVVVGVECSVGFAFAFAFGWRVLVTIRIARLVVSSI
jgi:hypothetical protein